MVGGDATDAATVDAAVAGCDAVISVIGAAYTRKPVEVYSASARLVVAAMRRHGAAQAPGRHLVGVVPSRRTRATSPPRVASCT